MAYDGHPVWLPIALDWLRSLIAEQYTHKADTNLSRLSNFWDLAHQKLLHQIALHDKHVPRPADPPDDLGF